MLPEEQGYSFQRNKSWICEQLVNDYNYKLNYKRNRKEANDKNHILIGSRNATKGNNSQL